MDSGEGASGANEGASDAGDNEDGENDGANDGDDDGEINGENDGDGDVTGVLVTGPSEIGVAAMDGPGEELDGAREGGTFGV